MKPTAPQFKRFTDDGDDATTYSVHSPQGGGFLRMERPQTDTWGTSWAGPGDRNPSAYDEHGQHEMFQTEYHPPKVTEIGVDPGMEHVVPRLLGLAARDSLRHYGRLPEADNDLSRHSLPVVSKLAAKGVISAPEGITLNGIVKGGRNTEEWIGDHVATNLYHGMDVPAAHVDEGSHLMRSVLRGRRSTPQAEGRQMEFSLGQGT